MSTLTATAPTGVPGTPRKPKTGKPDAFASAHDLYAAAAAKAMDPATLLAALDQLIPADVDPSQQPAWLGELYGSKTYQRRYAPLIQHGSLTGLKATGWRFIDGKTPTVGDFAGYPAQVPSTVVQTEAVTMDAKRLAGGAEVDRAYIDLPTPGFWEAYNREAANDYERKTDAKVPTLLTTAGNFTAVVADAVPAGVNKAMSYIIDGATSIIEAERSLPSFAIVGTALWKELLRTREQDTLAYLNAALKISGGSIETFSIVPSNLPAFAGKVLVGTNDAATLYELPGVPVRVETVNVAQGGVQRGLYGYWAGLVHDVKSLALVGTA